MLLGYTVAVALSGDPHAGWEAGYGVMAAAWVMAGAMKWRQGGAAWLRSGGLGLLVAERCHLGPAPLRWLRRAVVGSPRLCRLGSGLGIVLERGGVALLKPALRIPYAVGTSALLLLIALLLGYVELEWGLVVVAVAWSAG